MEALVGRGCEVRVLCGPLLDFEALKTNHELLHEQGIPYQTYRSSHAGEEFHLHMFSTDGVSCALWIPSGAPAEPTRAVGEAWLSTYREVLADWKPQVVLTYGGSWVVRPMLSLAKTAGARAAFYLCNFAYTERSFFEGVDVTIGASRYHAKWYREHIGIEVVPVYPTIPAERFLCEKDPRSNFLTFINPQPDKGVYVFAEISEVLSRRRPDIPMLVVEGRASSGWLARTGVALPGAKLFRMKNTPDPRDYLKVTKVLLVPSVVQESFGRVAAEAMMNGIPVVASNRGALPEVVGVSDLLKELPGWLTAESREMPSEKEVQGWVETIERLWDEPAYYQTVASELRERSGAWDPEAMAARLECVLFAPEAVPGES